MESVLGDDFGASLIAVTAVAVFAPLLADRLRRLLPMPSVVLELLLGILIGPALLGLAAVSPQLIAVSDVGLAMLFFLAGYEIRFREIKGRPVRLAACSWLLTVLAAGTVVLAVSRDPATALLLALAMSTTALGTILPIVRDAGLLRGKLGSRISAEGAMGEFAPVVALALLHSDSGHSGGVVAISLVVIVLVGAASLAMLRRSDRVSRLLSATLGTSVQFAIRLSVLVLIIGVWATVQLGVDLVLGAFAAGVVMRLILSNISEREAEVVQSKLDAVGFGVVVPLFFVYTGVSYDLNALLRPEALVATPLFLLGFLFLRGGAVWLVHRRDLAGGDRRRLALLSATQLPMVVVFAQFALDSDLISDSTAAALVGAALLSVLLFPLLAAGRAAAEARPATAVD